MMKLVHRAGRIGLTVSWPFHMRSVAMPSECIGRLAIGTMTKHLKHTIHLVAIAAALIGIRGVASADEPAPVAGPALGVYAGRLPFFGSFPNDSHLTNGYLCLKVSSKGAVSGTIAFAGYIYRVKSALVGGALGPLTITHRYGPSIVLSITLADASGITGTVNRVGQSPIAFSGGHALAPVPKHTAASPFPYYGLYTVGLDHVRGTWNETLNRDEWDHGDFLGERGYGLMKISKTGLATLKGQLPDGTKYAAASCAITFGPGILEVWTYAPTLKGLGSVVGFIQSLVNAGSPDDPVILSGSMRWYPDQFTHPDRSWLVAAGSEYTPPGAGVQILGVGHTLGAGLGGSVSQENFWDAGLDMNHANLFSLLGGAPAPSTPPAPYGVLLAAKGGVVSIGPGPATVAIAFYTKTGGFKATFIHPGTLKKTIGYGAIIQHRGNFGSGFLNGTLPGFGYGVFVNKVRQPDRSIVSHPGWIRLYPDTDVEGGFGDLGD
ncbi:MAG: hypothetical protein JNK37_08360 [Verrucomicrobiales bacterium]|nr:hypothetical protein [Verrucomicrobiales bacterium]